MTRVLDTVFSRRERQLLDWLCARMPAIVEPDHLTVLGIAGAVVVFAGYAASDGSRWWLWVASLGFLMHWLGDSLDGSLARYRRIERPMYGYFLDHTVDAICNLLVMAGLGFTPWVRMDVALFTLVGYYLLCIYVFINNQVSGVFQLSFVGLGPTELRFALVLINVWIFFCGWIGFRFGDTAFSYYDLLLLAAAFIFTAIFLLRVLKGIRELREPARGGAPIASFPSAPPQSASRNRSNLSK